MEQPPQTNEYDLLESLIVDNPDLEHLEVLLDQFNIFEALGAVRVELRHSDFLAFLLNPNQSHGLGDVFAIHPQQRKRKGGVEVAGTGAEVGFYMIL